MPPRPDRSAERRRQIMEAALGCFTRKGYNNTTMDDIAVESGLSKGSIYWYFDSKPELFASVIDLLFEGHAADVTALLERHDGYANKLRVGARLIAEMVRRSEGMFSLFLEFWAQSDNREAASQHWAEVLTDYERVIAGIMDEGVRSGEFRHVDTDGLVWAIMAAFDGLAAYSVLVPDLDIDRTSGALIETLLSGLSAAEVEK